MLGWEPVLVALVLIAAACEWHTFVEPVPPVGVHICTVFEAYAAAAPPHMYSV